MSLQNLRLAADLARRDLAVRYKRSQLGWGWLLLTPLCMLGIYWLVFGVLFGVHWRGPVAEGSQPVGFALPFFVGLWAYLYLSDLVNSATATFVSKRDFVSKSAFPLWVLWLANFLRATIQASVPFALVLTLSILEQRFSLAGLGWALLSLIPAMLFFMGLSLILTALGPFIGDISEANRLFLRVLFYATPITYPLAMIPERFQPLMWLNPLALIIEPMRAALVFETHADPIHLLALLLEATLLLLLGAWIFSRVKGVVADVV